MFPLALECMPHVSIRVYAPHTLAAPCFPPSYITKLLELIKIEVELLVQMNFRVHSLMVSLQTDQSYH